MRVLHVVPSLSTRTGGPAFGVVGSCLAVDRFGIDSVVVTTDLGTAAGATRRRAVIAGDLPTGADELDVRFVKASWPRRLAYSRDLMPRIDAATREGVDLMRIHSLFLYPQYAAFKAATRLRMPYVVSPHGSLDPFLRRRSRLVKRAANALWQRRMLEGAAAIHATTQEEANLIADVAPRVPRVIVPNGISWDQFQTAGDGDAFRNEFLQGDRRRVVLALGRLAAKKALDVLVDAFCSVASRRSDLILVIAGPDDECLRPRLESMAAERGMRARVFFPGMLGEDDRRNALAAASAWVLPSHTENFAIAAVEALAAGVPTIISSAVNIAPDVQAAAAGRLCEPDAASVAAELEALLDDDEMAGAMGERGRAFARRYDWDAVGRQLAGMYERILAGRGGTRT